MLINTMFIGADGMDSDLGGQLLQRDEAELNSTMMKLARRAWLWWIAENSAGSQLAYLQTRRIACPGDRHSGERRESCAVRENWASKSCACERLDSKLVTLYSFLASLFALCSIFRNCVTSLPGSALPRVAPWKSKLPRRESTRDPIRESEFRAEDRVNHEIRKGAPAMQHQSSMKGASSED